MNDSLKSWTRCGSSAAGFSSEEAGSVALWGMSASREGLAAARAAVVAEAERRQVRPRELATTLLLAVCEADLVAAFQYFSTVTLTTVGFGDIVAVTPAARLVTGRRKRLVQLKRRVGIGQQHVGFVHRKAGSGQARNCREPALQCLAPRS